MAAKQFIFRNEAHTKLLAGINTPAQAVRVTVGPRAARTVVLAKGIAVEGSGNFGLNALTNQYGDMVQMGVLDPCKVTRTPLQIAAAIAGLALTTECMMAQWPEEKRPKEQPEPSDLS